jgi:integrase
MLYVCIIVCIYCFIHTTGMPLTDTAVRNAKPKDRPYTLADGGALYLFVMPSGAKLWRYRFRWLGKQQTYSIGAYPIVGLADARQERDRARELLSKNIHPTKHRKRNRIAQQLSDAQTLEAIAREYLVSQEKQWDKRYASRVKRFLEANVFPTLGQFPIADVTSAHLLVILRKVEKRGSSSVAAKLRIWIGGVFRYAIATGRATNDPTFALRSALHLPQTVHAPPLEKHRIPSFVAALNVLEDTEPMLAIGMKLLLLCFVRGNELRSATTKEFDLDDQIWRVPAERMKARRPHVVPLSTQSVELVRRLMALNGDSKLLFPSQIKSVQPISEPMWRKALQIVGYATEITPHSLRATASTLLNEMGFNADWIERQLAHAHRSRTRATYNQAQFLPDRRRMMQEYADFIDGLAQKANQDGILGGRNSCRDEGKGT